ncbi:hypothetical protein BH10PSE9_BH10PSE9_03800 [soil metagenome]
MQRRNEIVHHEEDASAFLSEIFNCFGLKFRIDYLKIQTKNYLSPSA